MSINGNINQKANLIWSIADVLTGTYKPHEYGEVILPMMVIKRFDCILEDTKDAVLKKLPEVSNLPMKDIFLKKASGHPFYNTSKFNFKRLLDAPDSIEINFRSYLNDFSDNVKDILEHFEFERHIERLASHDLLYMIIKKFSTPDADLHPSKISNLEMGYIFEEIIRRFSEAHNEDAGQHYTPREVIELMVNILFNNDNSILTGNVAKTLYDPTVGTGGMLSVAEEYLSRLNKNAKLICYGQEINDQTFAICKGDMLIKGNDANNIKCGNTLSDDQFADDKFDYILSNPPFGREWKNDKNAVEKEAKLGFAGRFGAGLPPISDGQMLFLQTAIHKMRPEGSKVAIIQNGSPLFSGDAGSGQSEIRKYILENDLLEAIVALPNDLFYNTGIATYIWVFNNKKPVERKGKVQLINANGLYEKRRKSLGNKRNDIPQKYIDKITQIYGDFKENEISKIFNNEDFGYAKIVVERPQRDENGEIILKKGKPVADSELRDTENVPLTEDIHEYFQREVIPFAPDAWIDESKTKIGYEIPFTRYFYKYVPPRPSDEVLSEIMTLQKDLEQTLENHTITNIGAGIAKAVMNSNPITGFVQTIYDEYASRQWQQRREKWEEVFEEKLKDIQNDVDFLKINSIPNFAQILANATQGAMSDIEEDKVGLYANAVINSIKNENIDNTKTHIFLNMLRDFTKLHIEVLQELALLDNGIHPNLRHGRDSYIKQRIKEKNPQLIEDIGMFRLTALELQQKGLCVVTVIDMADNSDYDNVITTSLGQEFLQFIAEQENSNG